MTKRSTLEGITVLIVDDNAEWRELLEEVLTGYGACVVTAEGGAEAIRIVRETPPDALLSDISMPEMDGYTLIRAIRELEESRRATTNERPSLPAAAVTALSSKEDRRRSVSAGFRFHVAKPVSIPELVTTVAALVGRPDCAGMAPLR